MMGAAVLDIHVPTARPDYFDSLEVYPARDGQVLFQVYACKKGAVHFILRAACKLARFVQAIKRRTGQDTGDAVTDSNGLELFGLWDCEEKAQAECFYLKERSGGSLSVKYNEVRVNRTYGYERRPMKGLTDPTRPLLKGSTSTEQAAFTFVSLEEIDGMRREVEECRRILK